MTFCSTANLMVHLRAIPIIVDVELDTLNIDPLCLEAAIRRIGSFSPATVFSFYATKNLTTAGGGG